MATEDARRFLLRMKFDCDFFHEVAQIEDPDLRMERIRSEGYDLTAEEVRDSFGHPLPPPDGCDPSGVRETLWEEKHSKFECRAVYVGDNSALIEVSGEFDMAAAPHLREVLDRLSAEGITSHLALDLTDCTFIDSTGLGVLVRAQRLAKTPLNVAVSSEQVRQILGMTGFSGIFNLCESRDEALEALERQFGQL